MYLESKALALDTEHFLLTTSMENFMRLTLVVLLALTLMPIAPIAYGMEDQK
jgi:hypothetical protein